MDEFRRGYDMQSGHYDVLLWPGIESMELEVETPSGRKIPCRYDYLSRTLKSRLTEREELFVAPPNWIMVDRIPEILSPEVLDVVQRTIDEFLRQNEAPKRAG